MIRYRTFLIQHGQGSDFAPWGHSRPSSPPSDSSLWMSSFRSLWLKSATSIAALWMTSWFRQKRAGSYGRPSVWSTRDRLRPAKPGLREEPVHRANNRRALTASGYLRLHSIRRLHPSARSVHRPVCSLREDVKYDHLLRQQSCTIQSQIDQVSQKNLPDCPLDIPE